MTDSVLAVTRLAIWWHRKATGHHTRTYWRAHPVEVRCDGCRLEWRLA